MTWILVALATTASFAQPEGKPATATAQVRQLLVKYRAAHATVQQRASVIKDLVALGPDGVAAAKELIEKQMQQAGGRSVSPPNVAALDKPIAKLRQTLAELRKDENLSKDQLEKIGLPALEQLMALYRQRSARAVPYEAKAAKAAAQLEQVVAVLRILATQWKQEPPLPFGDLLAKAEKLLADTAAEGVEDRKILAENEVLAAQLPADAVSGMMGVNVLRMTCGLRPLVYDPKLCAAAAAHSAEMQSRNYFSHESPDPKKRTPWDRATLAGTTATGENIYHGATASSEAIKGWFLSPPHHKNMLNEANRRQGLGRAGDRWTQMFGE